MGRPVARGSTLDGYRVVIAGYALVGLGLALAFGRVSPAIEVDPGSRSTVTVGSGCTAHARSWPGSAGCQPRLFGGALAAQSLVAYWFTLKFGAQPQLLGLIFFASNILAGLSALVAARLARRIGLIPTMVYTHLPSNVLLILLPFMPTLGLAALVVFLRASLSQMDVPARQSYIVAVVDPDERSAAAGITGIARSLGAAPAPAISTPLIGIPALMSVPFVVGVSSRSPMTCCSIGCFGRCGHQKKVAQHPWQPRQSGRRVDTRLGHRLAAHHDLVMVHSTEANPAGCSPA